MERWGFAFEPGKEPRCLPPDRSRDMASSREGLTMGFKTETSLREETIRSVIREVTLRKSREEEAFFTRDLMDALEELTNVPRPELEQIAERVGRSHQDRDSFLSIKQQVVLVGATLLAFLGLPLMAVWLC
jgi:hypothetical protein